MTDELNLVTVKDDLTLLTFVRFQRVMIKHFFIVFKRRRKAKLYCFVTSMTEIQ